MKFCGCVGFLVIVGISLAKVETHESGINEHIRQQRDIQHHAKGHFEDNALIRNKKEHSHQYKYSKPEVIDDPLPEKVNYVPPVVVDFQQSQNQFKPIFIPAFASSSLIPKDDLEPPVNKYTAKQTTRYTTTTRKPYAYTKKPTKAPRNPGQIQTDNPNEDIVLLNYQHGPDKNFELFNVDDKIQLLATPPEVIYKPGDDISFADDKTVFDDYEHTFPPDTQQGKGKLDHTTLKPFSTTKKSKLNDGKYSGNSKHHLTSSSDHGYVYDRPAIPFES